MSIEDDGLIEIKLPKWQKKGGTSLLIRPESHDGIIPANYGADRLSVGLKLMTLNSPQVRINAPRTNTELLFNEDDALALVTCILSKLYYLRSGRT